MGIFDRLGNVINSYFNDFSRETNSRFKSSGNYRSNDPDLDAAFEELNEYLNDKKTNSGGKQTENRYSWRDSEDAKSETAHKTKPSGQNLPPQELRADYELLGVPFGADDETCKAAYKKLLKIHHPDRHAGHEGNYKKATERSAKINAAWDRITTWQAAQNERRK